MQAFLIEEPRFSSGDKETITSLDMNRMCLWGTFLGISSAADSIDCNAYDADVPTVSRD